MVMDTNNFAKQYAQAFLDSKQDAKVMPFFHGMSAAAYYLELFTTPFEGQVACHDANSEDLEALTKVVLAVIYG